MTTTAANIESSPKINYFWEITKTTAKQTNNKSKHINKTKQNLAIKAKRHKSLYTVIYIIILTL